MGLFFQDFAYLTPPPPASEFADENVALDLLRVLQGLRVSSRFSPAIFGVLPLSLRL